MGYYIKGNTANEVWREAGIMLLGENAIETKSRVGNTRELLHVTLCINNPEQRWITARKPPISIALIISELVCIFNGCDDSAILNFWNPTLPKYAGNKINYPGAYGKRLCEEFGINQFERAYLALKNNPNNRQTVLLIWNPLKDMPDEDGNPADSDIPCNIISMLKVRDDKLYWSQIMRSSDLYRGLPIDIAHFTAIQEIMAGWLGLQVGEYTHYCDSLHLYVSDNEKLQITQTSEEQNSLDLKTCKEQFDKIISEIFKRMQYISLNSFDEKEIIKIGILESGVGVYDDIMIILAAYAANKNGWKETVADLLRYRKDNLLFKMFDNWSEDRNGR